MPRAYTAVDAAEDAPETAHLINAEAPGQLARICADAGVRFVHVSTDYVFDGTNRTPYAESDHTCPLGVYGRTKLAGEQAVLAANPGALIVRTAWVFSEYGGNFLKTMLRLADRESVRVVDDQMGCPTDAYHLAGAIHAAIRQDLSGIAHYTDSPPTTWAGFASAVFEQALRLGQHQSVPEVISIQTKDYPTPAQRPAYSVLQNNRIAFAADWNDGIVRVLTALHS